MAEWYDTREGLQIAVDNGIPGLTELAKERSQAGYKRNERMSEWVLIGLYYLDTCGNFSLMIEGSPRSMRRQFDIKDVMTTDELRATGCGRWSSTPGGGIPPINQNCDRCGDGWNMRTIEDFHYRHREGSPYRHESCHKLAAIEGEQEFFKKVLERSEMPYTSMRAIPNNYSDDYPNPWFIVETKWGPLKIGWRRSVISIEWHGSQINHDGGVTFDDEEVTTGKTMVHAWGEDKAVEYLRILSKGNLDPAD